MVLMECFCCINVCTYIIVILLVCLTILTVTDFIHVQLLSLFFQISYNDLLMDSLCSCILNILGVLYHARNLDFGLFMG